MLLKAEVPLVFSAFRMSGFTPSQVLCFKYFIFNYFTPIISVGKQPIRLANANLYAFCVADLVFLVFQNSTHLPKFVRRIVYQSIVNKKEALRFPFNESIVKKDKQCPTGCPVFKLIICYFITNPSGS